ncbi:uncharacterized protein LOC110889276 isoform X3 [Helianthus annuus]|uniref:uncharacterized protein LOC110889276 isoform X3 n=1 Tax=Helianthus annuus TaxID=4232 RepID=UPI0016531458|nr:uncharacterized protein LOC110889276 isoform X3 [Helianthus annuus]
MACRRRHGITRSSTFKEEICRPPVDTATASSSAPSSPVASKKNHRDSPLSSGYVNSPFQHRSKKQIVRIFSRNMVICNIKNHRQFNSRHLAIMDKRTQDIQETFKLQNKKTEINREDFFKQNLWQDGKKQSEKPQTIHEHQLMASRDVRRHNCNCIFYIDQNFLVNKSTRATTLRVCLVG